VIHFTNGHFGAPNDRFALESVVTGRRKKPDSGRSLAQKIYAPKEGGSTLMRTVECGLTQSQRE
jgi:hypothetical protein